MRRRSRRAMAAMAVGVGLVVLAGVPSSAARSGALPSAQVAALAAVVGPAAMVRGWHLAGVILMGENIVSNGQVRATTAAVHAAVRADGRSWPAVVMVDEEGGRVSRLRGLLGDLPSFATLGGSGGDAATQARFAQLGADLAGLGFTMDFAPVADVTIGAADPTIGDRSASGDPAVAARTVRAASASTASR